jgi:hypothetical protein
MEISKAARCDQRGGIRIDRRLADVGIPRVVRFPIIETVMNVTRLRRMKIFAAALSSSTAL